MNDILQEIRDLQFTDRNGAEALLRSFLQEHFTPEVQSVEITPLAVSLNSFNGFLTLADGTRRFFKSHTETDTVIDEYYNAEMLATAGYAVLQPIYQSRAAGKQLLIYEVIEDPSVFDVAWKIENGDESEYTDLAEAQRRADRDLYEIFLQTLQAQTAVEAKKAPIHQLFYHRLTAGRLSRFYGFDTQFYLPAVGQIPAHAVRQQSWMINGQVYRESLEDLIRHAIELLNPASSGVSVVGHGDAHNGNVFLRRGNPPNLLYFDPAFAGRHDPLLDLVKPLFHNVFAMWMYFPQDKQASSTVTLQPDSDRWRVEYSYELPPVRRMFLESKVQQTLIPTLQYLAAQDQLATNWRRFLKAALFCCPLLTMNLADSERFPPEIALLGLAMSVEMGAESQGERSLIDTVLDEAEKAL